MLRTAVLMLLLGLPTVAVADPALELAGGLFKPLVQQDDALRDGYELTVGLSASYSRSIQLFFSGSYARVSTADSVQVWPETNWSPAAYAKQDDWVFLNLSFDFRFGWGLDGPRQFWYSGGIGWYHVKVGDAVTDGGRSYSVPSANAPGFRFGVGGALPLGDRTRIGLTARYTIVDAAHQQWEYYVGALQVQAFLGFGF